MTNMFDVGAARYTENGSLDNTFGLGGIVVVEALPFQDYIYSIAIQLDGKIVLGGSHDDNLSIVRLNANGTFDNTFGVDGLVKLVIGLPSMSEIREMVIQRDRKIVAVGLDYNELFDRGFGLARFNTDGSLDTSFAGLGHKTFNIGSGNDFSLGVGLQRNDKIVISGHSYKGTNPLQHDLAVARLNVDGSLDLSKTCY